MTPAEIIAIRERLHLTRQQFASKLRVNIATVRRWEDGVRPISSHYERAILDVAGLVETSVRDGNPKRAELTLHYPPLLMRGDRCIYCNDTVRPILSTTGTTHNLDHFIPVHFLAVLRQWYPDLQPSNLLVPSCARCNNIGNGYVFMSLFEKRDYIRARIGIYAAMPDTENVTLDDAIVSLIRSQLRLGDYLFEMMVERASLPLPTACPVSSTGQASVLDTGANPVLDTGLHPYRASIDPGWIIAECVLPHPSFSRGEHDRMLNAWFRDEDTTAIDDDWLSPIL